MRMILRLMLLLPALLPAAAAAQTPPDETIRRALDRAREAGIPVALLESKVAEGRAKGIPMARIAGAVERRLEMLERAQNAVDTDHRFTPEELGVAGDALAAGVSEEVLKSIATTAPRERRSVAIAALSQLVRLGHPAEEALRRVNDAMRRGPDALMNLPAQAAAAAQRRGPPIDVPAAQGRGGPPPGVPAGPPPKPPRGGGGSES